MANTEQISILSEGVTSWNAWRETHHPPFDLSGAHLEHADLRGANLKSVDLRGADLGGANLCDAQLDYAWLDKANLCSANFTRANLSGANLNNAFLSYATLNDATLSKANFVAANLDRADLRKSNLTDACLLVADLSETNLGGACLNRAWLDGANLRMADLARADLTLAHLSGTNFRSASLCEANLSGADLTGAILIEADLTGANLSGANLSGAHFVNTNLERTILTGCSVYGISAWGLKLEGAKQFDLVITPYNEPTITVDNLEIAQFIYLILDNQRIRNVINTLTTKTVLILGRFTTERKQVLEVVRGELRRRNYLPVLFDFEKPITRDTTETVSTLAHLSRFIIADLTDPRSVQQELQAIIPNIAVPVQPILLVSQSEWSMFVDLKKFPWVLPILYYKDTDDLLALLDTKVISPAEAKARELEKR